jgi:hypothetical protein
MMGGTAETSFWGTTGLGALKGFIDLVVAF